MRTSHSWLGAGLLVSLLLSSPALGSADDLFPSFDVSVAAQGLEQPDGLALHPVSGELYVSEEAAGRISVIRDGRAIPVVSSTFPVGGEVPDYLITAERPRSAWLEGRLLSPEGIAFGPDNRLYVVEDTPRGRLLSFETDASGRYPQAQLVPVPELGEPYAWESLCFGKDGQLFLAGSSFEGSQTWGYSCVLARDTTQTWWMADYGPLASFSALALMEDEQVLVAGDESVGSLTWWDLEKHREIQTLNKSLGVLEGLCVLPDGSVVAAVEQSESGGRLLRINPASGAVTEIASGLGSLESVICDRRTGKLYVSEDSTGRVLCFTPRSPIPAGRELLAAIRRSGEARRGQPSRETPAFLKQFMSKVGVDIVDEGDSANGSPTGNKNQPVSMEELGKRIPLVAGRVRVADMPGHPDPIVEVNFLSLFPNQVINSGNNPMPSLCFFSARHRSGKVDRTQSLGGIKGRRISPDGRWSDLGAEALMMAPLSTCSAVENANGVTVVVTFLGLDKFNDCFLTMNYGRTNDAYFATSGEDLHVAQASFSEQGHDGQETLNFAMTGVRTRSMEDATWMRIHPQANWTLLTPGFDTWISRRCIAVMPELVAKMRRYNHYVIDALLADVPGEPPGDITRKTEIKSAPQAKIEQPSEQAPRKDLIPVADLRIAPPADDADLSLTNILLSRIVQAWDKGWEN